MAIDRTPARIGTLFFKYIDPDVTVQTESRTVEHQTIDDSIVVQRLGRRPDQVTVNVVVTESESKIVDDLTETGIVRLRTERWQGDVLVTSTNTEFMRALDEDGQWLYRATIRCIEAEKQEPDVEPPPESGGGGGSIRLLT